MNFVVINGNSSTEIRGLLIQSLPPISKPLLRTEIEEIDGRDGDVITKLGYSAYDKEFEIGLHGHFSIDQIISFFDTEGTVVFSNEPDKYYKFTMLEQIDFERLLIFRTAVIRMHVQPFKYMNEEPVVGESSVTVWNRGNMVARPKITIHGSGDIEVSLNGTQMFSITLGTEEYITIDTNAMEAEKNGILKNRLVTGDYDNFVLQVGSNSITTAGTVTEIVVENYSRWK